MFVTSQVGCYSKTAVKASIIWIGFCGFMILFWINVMNEQTQKKHMAQKQNPSQIGVHFPFWHLLDCGSVQVKSAEHMAQKQNPSQIGVHFPFFVKLNVRSMIVPKFLHEIEAAAICFAMERGCR